MAGCSRQASLSLMMTLPSSPIRLVKHPPLPSTQLQEAAEPLEQCTQPDPYNHPGKRCYIGAGAPCCFLHNWAARHHASNGTSPQHSCVTNNCTICPHHPHRTPRPTALPATALPCTALLANKTLTATCSLVMHTQRASLGKPLACKTLVLRCFSTPPSCHHHTSATLTASSFRTFPFGFSKKCFISVEA